MHRRRLCALGSRRRGTNSESLMTVWSVGGRGQATVHCGAAHGTGRHGMLPPPPPPLTGTHLGVGAHLLFRYHAAQWQQQRSSDAVGILMAACHVEPSRLKM